MKTYTAYDSLISVLSPENFDTALEAVKSISRYDPIHRTFGAASLALHFRTTLVALCNLASKLLLRKKLPFSLSNVDKTLTDIEIFKKLVETQWAREIGSLALKDLTEKTSVKPKLIPLTEDIIKLINFVEGKAAEAFKNIKNLNSHKDVNMYRVLVETVLVLTILHNRKRVGDVQYLELKPCEQQFGNEATKQNDFKDSLQRARKY